jgi:hypothetical protein
MNANGTMATLEGHVEIPDWEVLNMKPTLQRSGLVLAGALAVALVLVWTNSVDARPDDPAPVPGLTELTERVRAIEKTLALPERDPTRPAIERRLSILEDGLRTLTRATGQPAWSAASINLRELQESVKDSTRLHAELLRRLERLEQARPDHERPAPVATPDDVQEIRRTTETARRETEQLNQRVQQLERDVTGRSNPPPNPVSADLKDRLDDLRRTVDTLQERVRRLESRS